MIHVNENMDSENIHCNIFCKKREFFFLRIKNCALYSSHFYWCIYFFVHNYLLTKKSSFFVGDMFYYIMKGGLDDTQSNC